MEYDFKKLLEENFDNISQEEKMLAYNVRIGNSQWIIDELGVSSTKEVPTGEHEYVECECCGQDKKVEIFETVKCTKADKEEQWRDIKKEVMMIKKKLISKNSNGK